MSKETKGVKKVSFFNWVVTLIVSVIPGVNILFFIITSMFAKNPSKRMYAAAALVLTLLVLIACCVAVIFFGTELVEWAQEAIDSVPKSDLGEIVT